MTVSSLGGGPGACKGEGCHEGGWAPAAAGVPWGHEVVNTIDVHVSGDGVKMGPSQPPPPPHLFPPKACPPHNSKKCFKPTYLRNAPFPRGSPRSLARCAGLRDVPV